jgi:predicted transposase/invertase (TIGR01784 family)
MGMNRYIRFDWAAKYMLRNKADFAIFEGLISVLVNDKVTIVELLDTESNKETKDDKYNRVDVKAKNSKGEIILVEIQQTREHDYLQRMIYGVAKTITEHMSSGQRYENVKKVFSINILYFNLGEGEDYLYHGQTVLKGVHTSDSLKLTDYERDDLHVLSPDQVFPEYYVIRVNEFDKVTISSWLEEWMDYLKNERIRPDTTAPGLQEARQRLALLNMSDEERKRYEHDIDTLVRDTDVMRTQLLEAEIKGRKKGLAEGRAEGRAEGLAEGHEKGLAEGEHNRAMETARRMKAKGFPVENISEMTDLSAEEIAAL